jgi:hypothetical protein
MDIVSFVIGNSKGYSKGYTKGHTEGHSEGYSEGKEVAAILSVEENGAGGLTYELEAPESPMVDKAVLDALVDGTISGELRSDDVRAVKLYKFHGCNKLTKAIFPNAASVGDRAFYNCSALTDIDLQNVTSIGQYAFYSCSALKNAYFPNVTSIGMYSFYSCKGLETVYFPELVLGADRAFAYAGFKTGYFPKLTQINNEMFNYNSKVTELIFPSVTTLSQNAFTGCNKLEKVDFCKKVNIGTFVFLNCSNLKTLILRSTTMCELYGTSPLNGTPSSGHFYVPRALLSDEDETMDYRRATNWSDYASRFRALEDYTVDGTITGDLDPEKI